MNLASGNRRNLDVLQSGYNIKGGINFPLSPANQQVQLHSYAVNNANVVACDVGLGVAYGNYAWKLYSLVSGVAADLTSSVQSNVASQIFTLVNDDGYMVSCQHPFGYLYLEVGQASTGSPVYSYDYFNGSVWSTLTPLQTPVYSSSGSVFLAFNPPVDWVAGDGGYTADSLYSIRVLASTAPTQVVNLSGMAVSKWLYYQTSLAANSRLQVTFDPHPVLLENAEALSPYFSLSYVQNSIEASYQVAP